MAMPSSNDNGARRSSSRRRGSNNERHAERNSSSRSNTPAPASAPTARRSLKSQQHHHILPQDFIHSPSKNKSPIKDSPNNASPSNGTGSGSSPGGKSKTSSRIRPGAPPPPPPPPPPFTRIRNSSFHSASVAVAGNNNNNDANTNASRGRSLSTARSGSRMKSRHGEAKEGGANDNDNDTKDGRGRVGRSLSAARSRSKAAAAASSSKSNTNNNTTTSSSTAAASKSTTTSSVLPLIDADGQHRPRSRSISKSRGGGGGGAKEGGRSSSSKSRKPKKPDRRLSDASEQSSKQAMGIAENTSSSRRNRETRSRSRGRSSSRARNTTTTNNNNANNDNDATVVATKKKKKKQKQQQPNLKASRKFVVEINQHSNEVVQVFEFSDNGSLPTPDAFATGSAKRKEPAFIDTIRRKYSGNGSDNDNDNETRSKASKGRDDKKKTATRKIVIKSDHEDNIIQVTEFPSASGSASATGGVLATGVVTAAATSTKREDSPFSKRQNHVDRNNEDTVITTAKSAAASSDHLVDSREKKKKKKKPLSSSSSSSRRSSRHRSSARSRSSSALRSSLRTTTTTGAPLEESQSNNNLSQAQANNNVSFALSDKSLDRSDDRLLESSSRAGGDQSESFKGDGQDRQPSAGFDLSDKSLDRSDKSLNMSDKSMDKSDKSLERSDRSVRSSRAAGGRSVTFKADKKVRRQAGDRPAISNSKSALDISEKSDASARRSVSFMEDQDRDNELLTSLVPSKKLPARGGKAALDTSERSNDSGSRRSVSFMMDQQDDSKLNFRGPSSSSTIMSSSVASSTHTRPSAYECKHMNTPPTSDRLAALAEDLQGFRRARSVSSSRKNHTTSTVITTDLDSTVVINDLSSLTAGSQPTTSFSTRGRSADSDSQGHSAAPRQARSLSRTRNGVTLHEVDFDPEASITKPPSSSPPTPVYDYTTAFQKDELPYDEKVPLQKSQISHSTAETYVSALTCEEEEDSHFTNQNSTLAVKDHGGGPLMNSTLTIIESGECHDEDEQSLLSDPTSSVDQQPLAAYPASTNKGPKVHIMEDDSDDDDAKKGKESKQERRSRIRKMLSRKASSKRKPTPTTTTTSSSLKPPSSLDTSETTRETMGTDGSNSNCPSFMMVESAENSLWIHQSHLATAQRGQRGSHYQESERSSSGEKQKSRLSRFLGREN